MRRALLSGSVFVLLACSTIDATEVFADIDADSISRLRARQLHVRVINQDGVTKLDRVASLFGDPPDVELPTTVPLIPEDVDDARTFTFFAELLDKDKISFNKTEHTQLSFTDQKQVHFPFHFSDLCIGIECPAGETCADGSCVDSKTPPHGSGGPLTTDAQPAYCEGPLCWEEPRPGGQGAKAACLWAPDAGLAIGSYWAQELKGGLWISEPLPPGASSSAIACWSGGEAIATSGTGVLERSPSGWKQLDLGGAALHGIWGLDAGDVWAVGDGGAIWRRKSHGSWAKVSSGVSTDLVGIFGLGASDIYVVGSQSTLLHYDGSTFTAVPGPAAADPAFTHVAGTSKNDLSIKAGASVWSFDGKAWSEYAPYLGVVSLTGGPSGLLIAGGSRGTAHFRAKVGAPWGLAPVAYPFDGPGLQALAISGQSAIVGGEAGALSHWSGSTWDSSAEWLTRGYLRGIANDPDDLVHAVVVADGGLVLERVGEGLWRRRVVGQGGEVKTPDLRAVWAGHQTFVAVGVAGAIVESTNGHDWSLLADVTTQDLAAVDSAGGKVVAAGAAGVLLERGASGWVPFTTPIPMSPSITALRGAEDGSLFAGAADGAVWKFSPGAGWVQLGTLPAAVSDLGLDTGGGLWACADGVYHLEAGTFSPLVVSTSGPPHRFLIDGASPGWISTDLIAYQRQPDGSYAGVGPQATAMSAAANGRFFMTGNYGRILAARP